MSIGKSVLLSALTIDASDLKSQIDTVENHFRMQLEMLMSSRLPQRISEEP